jgi:hypothetical protein
MGPSSIKPVTTPPAILQAVANQLPDKSLEGCDGDRKHRNPAQSPHAHRYNDPPALAVSQLNSRQSSNKDREIAWCFEGVLGAREQKCFLVFALAPPPPCVIAASAIVEGEFSGSERTGKRSQATPYAGAGLI